jgi:uncharacterized circularly permuted ATP-grasp superfamily protein/uncharacterized alpha-E superfamily protein
MQDNTAAIAASQAYRPAPGTWNECRLPDGSVRPGWRKLHAALSALASEPLRQHADQVRQLVRDHGISYQPPTDSVAVERPWRLDPLPAVIDPAEFTALGRGLAQRAVLLDRVLADLYGPQELLRQGVLPARLILANPAFLRPCHGQALPTRLLVYAADLVRTSTGGFCVLRDRTQAPTGLGYALADRLVLAQVLAEPFRQGNVLRLAPFFRTLREGLAGLTPAPREQPRIVLQSAGAASPTHFEQAFLAQYLGYPLVEGADLTVRDRRVFLKTLGGLHPVDVILRQPEDDFCDPLELRADSQLGVPGLVEAVRAGQVAVANALGAGLVQSPALLPFLPAIARHFLGEDLSLASAPAYWCGEPAALAHVLAHLDSMVLRPVWPGAGPTLSLGWQLDAAERQALGAALQNSPVDYVAQERVTLGSSPVFDGARVESRPTVLRCYATRGQESYEVMPGGLALAPASPDDDDIAVSRGALAKDVWVRGEAPAGHFSLLPPATRALELSRGGADLPSRSADNLYWLGRYAERAESTARLARYLLGRLAEEGDLLLQRTPALPTLFAVLATAAEARPPAARAEELLGWLAHTLCSPTPPGSLYNNLRAALRTAAAIRDRLSADTLRVLGLLGDEADRAERLARVRSLGDLSAFLDRVVTSLSALSGLVMESMTRGHGWRFLDMGRRLERALQLSSLLRAAFAHGADCESTLLEALLAAADSSITYRRRYLAGLHPAAVVDLVLVDDGNPRAVIFQLGALCEHLRALPRDDERARLRPEERLALAALTRLQLLDVAAACTSAAPHVPPPLYDTLGEIEAGLAALSDELSGGRLNHALMPRALAPEPFAGEPG